MSDPRERAVVFADFDGTITAHETFVAMLRRFAPELSAELIPEMYALRVTLREGVRRILESIPSASLPAIEASARAAPVRAGLNELLDFLDARAVPFVIVSGGLRVMVEATLGPLLARARAAYAVDVSAGSPTLRVRSELEGGDELVSKVDAMALHPCRESVAVGDSVTDLNMALAADLVFARDKLCGYLDERGVAYQSWGDFHDVRRELDRRWAAAEGTRAG